MKGINEKQCMSIEGVMSLSLWDVRKALVSKGGLGSDSPSFARVYEERNEDS